MSTCENYDTTNPTVLTIEGVYKHGESQSLNVSQQVEFRDVVRDGSGVITSQEVIPLQRNHLYKVVLSPKYDLGGLVFDKISYSIQVIDWQSGETLKFARDENLTKQSTPSFTVTNAESISGTELDGVTNPTLIITGASDHSIYLTVTSETTGTMLESATFPSTQYGLISSSTTNDANGNLVETYKIDIDANILKFTEYTFTLSNAINTSLARTFVLRKEPVVNIGDFYYTDGTWSTDYVAGKTIAGIVFVNNPSDYDKSQGFDHGYAVALKDYTNGSVSLFQWKNDNTNVSEGINSVESRGTRATSSGTVEYDVDLIYNTIIADLDGYKHTMTIRNKANYATIYPAFYAALSYTGGISFSAGVVNSGWYLPSLGQYYWMFVNLCSKIATWPSGVIDKMETCFDVVGDNPVSNFNTYLQQRIITDAGKTASYYSPLRTWETVTNNANSLDYMTSSEQIRKVTTIDTGTTETGYMCMTFRQYKTPADRHNTVRFDPNGKIIEGPVRAVIAF